MSNLTNNTSELRDILAAVNALPEASGGGGITPSGTKQITENGTYDVTNYASAEVNVSYEEPVLQEKNDITPTESQQTITPDSGYDGLSKVVVNKIPDTYIIPSGTKNITANGDSIDVSSYATVNVNVPTSSGSGEIETCTVTTRFDGYDDVDFEVYYSTVINGALELQREAVSTDATLVCAKNSMLVLWSSLSSANTEGTGDVILEAASGWVTTYSVEGDGTVLADANI